MDPCKLSAGAHLNAGSVQAPNQARSGMIWDQDAVSYGGTLSPVRHLWDADTKIQKQTQDHILDGQMYSNALPSLFICLCDTFRILTSQ